jgi:class 3 adenylate cyclase
MSQAVRTLRKYFKTKIDHVVFRHHSLLDEIFKGPIQKVSEGDFEDLITTRRKLFHIVFSNLGDALLVRENLDVSGNGGASNAPFDEERANRAYKRELKKLGAMIEERIRWKLFYKDSGLEDEIPKLLKELDVLFFVCNYFSPVLADPKREPVVTVVRGINAHNAKIAYDIFCLLRHKYMTREAAYPINDLIGKFATTKKVWAIQFIREGECHYIQDGIKRREVKELSELEPVTLAVPVEAFGSLPTAQKLKGSYQELQKTRKLGGLPNVEEEIFRLFDSPFIVNYPSNPLLKDTLEKTVDYLKWNFFQANELGGEQYNVIPRAAYVVLAALLPFNILLKMNYHYAFPAHFSVPVLDTTSDPDKVILETCCSTLSVGTREKSIEATDRKTLSDLALRVLLTPLAQDYGIRLKAIESQRNILSRYLGHKVDVEKILFKGSSFWGQTLSVFVDLTNFTALYQTIQKHLTGHGGSQAVLALLQDLWGQVTTQIHLYEGAVGAYLGDGIYFYFSEATPFNRAYPQSSQVQTIVRKGFAAVLSLQPILDRVWKKWLQGKPNDLKKDLERQKLLHPTFHIGVSLKQVSLGNLVGGKEGFHFTGVGDAVNAASRMQALANRKSREMIVDEAIYDYLLQTLEEEGKKLSDYLAFLDYKNRKPGKPPVSGDKKVPLLIPTLAGKKDERTDKYQPFVDFRVVPLRVRNAAKAKKLQELLFIPTQGR